MSETVADIWQDRRVNIGYETAEELAKKLNPANFRGHPESQADALDDSLDLLGWVGSVKLNIRTDRIFDGELRIKRTLVKDPKLPIPVDYYDLSPDEELLALQVHDAITEQAEPIPDKLASLLERTRALTTDKPGLKTMLESLKEKAGINGTNGKKKDVQPQDNNAKELQAKWSTALGQVWKLGDHRLYIGDVANSHKNLDYLLGGKLVGLVVTDPPFTFGLSSTMKGAAKVGGWVDLMNSAQWFASWYSLINDVLGEDGAMWTCCSWRSFPVVAYASDLAGWGITSLLIWDKDWIGPGGNQGLRPSYEMVALFCKSGFSIPNRGINDIWTIPWSSYKPTGHAAEKPVDLFVKMIKESGEHEIVLDPFGGSGTTIVACEQLNRRAYTAEMSLDYAAVTIQRWVDLTGGEPVCEFC